MSVSFLAGCAKKEENASMVSQIDETNNKEEIPEESYMNLNEEILAVEESSLEIQKQLQAASTQAEMNMISGQYCQLWDAELNSLWSRLNDNAARISRR